MKRKKDSLVNVFVLCVISLFLLTNFISAAPPFAQANVFTEGYEIKYPLQGILKLNLNHTFSFHVYNISNGVPIDNSSTNCIFHLYDSNGLHLLETDAEYKSDNLGNEWEVFVAGGNFSEIGEQCYLFQCNSSSLGGFASVTFKVNYLGKELSTAQSLIYLGLLGIFFSILFATFFGMKYLPKSNKQDESGKILSVNYLKHFRLVLWLSAYFLFIAIIFLSSNIAFAFLEEQLFAKTLFSIFSILLAISPIVMILIVISFFVKFFHDREFQQMLNRGMFPQGKT